MASDPPLSGPERPPASGRAARALVVLLHGIGADGGDLIELAGPWSRLLPDVHFIAPNGPEACDRAPQGYQWFSLRDHAPEALLEGVSKATPRVDGFLDAMLARLGLAEDRLVLVGFSQGTMTALHLAPRRARPLAGVIGYSGALVAPERLEGEVRSRPPVLLVHGDQDPVVPVEALLAAAGGLGKAGVTVTWHVSPGVGHGIDGQGLELGARFLASVFEEPGRSL